MPQKTKKQKVRAHEKKEEVVVVSKQSATPVRDDKKSYFMHDIRKSLFIIFVIFMIEIGLSIASHYQMIPFISPR